MRILLVEDDGQLGDATQIALRQRGHAVDWVRMADDGEVALTTAEYDVLVLDIGLPGISGLDWLRRLRARQLDLPVLLLTARDRTSQRVEGLDAGADDYLIKPFDLAELEARLRAVTRRKEGRGSPAISFGAVTLDTAAHTASLRGEAVPLSAREYALLELLMQRPGHILDKSAIEERLYDWDSSIESNAVEVYVSRLRRKFGKDFIKTIRGLGYVVEKIA